MTTHHSREHPSLAQTTFWLFTHTHIRAATGAASPRGRSEARGGGQSRGANAADGGESDEAPAAIPLGGRERESEAVGRVARGRCESGAAARAPCEGEGHTPRMSPRRHEMPGIVGALICR